VGSLKQGHAVLSPGDSYPASSLPIEMQPTIFPPVVPPKRPKRKKRLRWWMIAISLLLILAIVGFSQASGQGGAALADFMRATLGPTLTAQIESWYLGLNDNIHQLQYRLQGQQTAPPWQTKSPGVVNVGMPNAKTTPIPGTTATATPAFAAMALPQLTPLISPALDGEGIWQIETLSSPTAQIPSLPIIARTYIRPDPVRPYAIVTLLQFDTRFMTLHMVAGTTEPGGPRGAYGPGTIPAADQQTLLAAFNGGFKYADGQYGMAANGITYVPPQPNSATIAVTKEGQIILGAWGVDPRLASSNTDLIAWRQNAALLIDHGTLNPLTQDGAAWGGTVLNSTYTWRSGIGLTANGSLLYAAGNSLSARTLGVALQAAGAVMAMQTDINPFWVRAFLYTHNAQGQFTVTKLNPSMQGTGYEYLSKTARDFFYLTYTTPAPPGSSYRRELPSQ
jgi:hypothetical protein